MTTNLKSLKMFQVRDFPKELKTNGANKSVKHLKVRIKVISDDKVSKNKKETNFQSEC